MAVFIHDTTKVLVQGITGNQGRFHTQLMQEYGTQIVAGVTPGREGEEVFNIPVYNTVKKAVEEQGADTAILFVPAPFTRDAAFETMEHLSQVVIITEGVPVHDSMALMARAREKGVRIFGPNTAGLISPGRCKVGIMPSMVFQEGEIGVISRSGTLAYEIAFSLSEAGFGQSSLIGIGGDRIVGTSFVDALTAMEADDETTGVVLIGEIGGEAEEEAALYIAGMKKPVVAYIAGRTAPEGKRMGHAGAIISGGRGTAQGKIKALQDAGAQVAGIPTEIPDLLKGLL